MPILTTSFNGTFAMRRLGTVLDPFIPISESRQIENNRLTLTEIPDSFNRVIVTSDDGKLWYELPIGIPTENQYVVDYNEGFIDFHSSNNLLTVNCQYLGTGFHYLSASRIIVGSSNIDIAQTLQDVVDVANEAMVDYVNEQERISNENTRVSAENIRISNETTRGINETSRVTTEGTRVNSENTRIANELARVSAENIRIANGALIKSGDTMNGILNMNNTLTMNENAINLGGFKIKHNPNLNSLDIEF